MTLNEFLTKWNNEYCEVVDPSNPNQCFDLVVAWADSLTIPRVFPFAYAYQIYSNFGPLQAQYFDRIFNGPNDIPKEGDIIVWSWYYNNAGGHTGVCKVGRLYDLEVFEQNDPIGSTCHVKTYGYTNVLGWLRPKNYSVVLSLEQKIAKVISILNTSGTTDTAKVQQIRTILGV